MKKRFFFRNIGAILTYAFVGTTLSTFTVAGIMYGVTQTFKHLATKFTFLDRCEYFPFFPRLPYWNSLHGELNNLVVKIFFRKISQF